MQEPAAERWICCNPGGQLKPQRKRTHRVVAERVDRGPVILEEGLRARPLYSVAAASARVKFFPFLG